jgi:cell wall-active antibiotic response 4TMS protein YvqF/uncharacterized protein DUF1707
MAPSDPSPASLVALRDARERAIAQLSDAFAHDVIELDEFERRLALVHRATSVSEVTSTISDLAESTAPIVLAPAAHQPAALAPQAHGRSRPIVAIFGGLERRGSWTPPRSVRAMAIFGGMVLDFRDASLPPGFTEINVVALMGGVQLIVPPNLSVEVSGTAILGGVDHLDRAPPQADPDRPVLRVYGLAVMGGIAVETRLQGESEQEAHRRRSRARRSLARGEEPRRLPEKTGR